jgi:hypothetical protein
MAVISGVTVVPNARIAGVAAVAAMRKTLKHDGGKRVLRKQEGERAHKSYEPIFHTFPMPQCAYCTAVIVGVEEFHTEFARGRHLILVVDHRYWFFASRASHTWHFNNQAFKFIFWSVDYWLIW